MQILPFSDLFGGSVPQARSRDACKKNWGFFPRLACELAGLAGLLAWLSVLFYVTALCSA